MAAAAVRYLRPAGAPYAGPVEALPRPELRCVREDERAPLDQGEFRRVLGHFATEDVPFPIATVNTLEEKLRAAHVRFEFHRYQAKHAFANETLDSTRRPSRPRAASSSPDQVRAKNPRSSSLRCSRTRNAPAMLVGSKIKGP